MSTPHFQNWRGKPRDIRLWHNLNVKSKHSSGGSVSADPLECSAACSSRSLGRIDHPDFVNTLGGRSRSSSLASHSMGDAERPIHRQRSILHRSTRNPADLACVGRRISRGCPKMGRFARRHHASRGGIDVPPVGSTLGPRRSEVDHPDFLRRSVCLHDFHGIRDDAGAALGVTVSHGPVWWSRCSRLGDPQQRGTG